MEILGNELGRGSSYEIPKELKKRAGQSSDISPSWAKFHKNMGIFFKPVTLHF